MPRKKIDNSENQLRSLEANGFYSILSRKDTMYGVLVRSPVFSGKIKSITCPDLPDNYYLYTAENIPGKKSVKIKNIESKIFGYGNIGYNGEPLGILIGPDESKLKELAETIIFNFDVETLESAVQQVITNESSGKEKENTIHNQQEAENIVSELTATKEFSDFVDIINEMPSLDTVLDKTHVEENPNQIVSSRVIKTGIYAEKTEEEAEEILSEQADYVLKNTWNQVLVNPKWHEPDGAFCYIESGCLHVYVSTKWTYNLQTTLSEVLSLPEEKIFIHKTKSSGMYPNVLWRINQLAVQVAVACYLSKKPVKLVLSPEEQENQMAPGVNANITYETCITNTGKIKALKAFIDIDIGYENPFSQEITDRMAIAVCNYYRPENLFINAVAHTSKNPPTTIHLKCVDSQIFFATESMIQTICNKTNLFPYEVREINSQIKKNDNFPFDIQLTGLPETIKVTMKESDFNRKYASFHMDAIDRIEQDSRPFFALPLRGIGMATAYNISGFCGESSFSADAKMQITLTTENKVIINAIKPSDVVQGIWKKTASETLQIPVENIEIISDFPLAEMPKAPEDTFSTIGILNELVKKCCTEIQRKRFHNPLPITSKKSVNSVLKKSWDSENFTGNPFLTTASVSTIVEVELDNYTYSQKIKGVWIAIDCGEIFDEAAAMRTVKLEIQQELATLVQDKSLSYENLHIKFIESNNKSGQIGELVHNSLPAAFASAMSLALTTQITQLPVTEKQIYNLIKKRTTRGGN